MSLTRRRFLTTATAAASAAALPATLLSRPARAAAPFRYKLSNNVAPDHPFNLRARAAVERIRDESRGQLDIQIFPNNQLGSDVDVLSQTRAGAVELQALSAVTLSTLVPVSSITGVGFAFKDYDTVWAATDGKLGAHVREEIRKRGLYAFSRVWDIGYRQITTSARPVQTPADLKGLKIRVPPGALWTSLFQSFGGSPTTINFSELYSALQTRIADGEENPLSIIATAKLFEVQKFCSLTNHMWDGLWLLANPRAWDRLPAELRQIAERAFNDAALLERQDVAGLNQSLRGELAGKGLVFNTPDPQPFRQALRSAGFYPKWQEKFGADAWALLEAYAGKLV
ncbi:TRAP transporter substrate-binding protein [Chitinasiproducens palmae]|uniref:Tripartite ATP-independent transporter solute receptor, DctP family n=1 Tax=Chitinasiproducens palmae TaxID=1770053 RepID=A0A1H2PR96_9BURK|nr:TRAP transporter substrate-binding protein [Chitinasiproducens palmae]SDV48986.1 tripartite ATP-independent transporter solute receptor, DctP family [Chitinasiproducens palmae]